MANKTVKLGLMPPFTGLVGIYGEEVSRAGQIACQEVNKKRQRAGAAFAAGDRG